MARKELIVSFIHSNYLVKNGGTEKFVSDLSKVLQEKGFDHLCFFSFIKQKSITGKDIVGVNYNDKFRGIIESNNMADTIRYYLCKENAILNSFHIQHLKYHNISDVINALNTTKSGIFVFVHDFYMACCSEHFISSRGLFCGDLRASQEKCAECEYYEKEKKHLKQIEGFFKSIENRIESIICPSQYVREVFKKIYPQYESKTIVRPHLQFNYKGETVQNKIDSQIRLAFLGRKYKQKGYDQWEKLIAQIPSNNYELFYLGIDTEKGSDLNQVKHVFVSTTTQGSDAMVKSVSANNIECAFIWPQCPETYSYVYYELLMSGVYIVTNSISGNIAEEIRTVGNGKIFDSIDSCIQWMKNPELVLDELNRYRASAKLQPSEYHINSDIQQCVSAYPVDLDNHIGGRKKYLLLSTVMYRIKFAKYKV